MTTQNQLQQGRKEQKGNFLKCNPKSNPFFKKVANNQQCLSAKFAYIIGNELVPCKETDTDAFPLRDSNGNVQSSYLSRFTNPTTNLRKEFADPGSDLHIFNSELRLTNVRKLGSPKIVQAANSTPGSEMVIRIAGDLQIIADNQCCSEFNAN